MKIALKINFSSPWLFVLGFFFLYFFPYLYPSFHFPYTKVFPWYVHLAVSLFFSILILIAFKLSKIKILSKPNFDLPSVSSQFYFLSKVGIYVALLMNIFIIINGLLSFQGNILSVKDSLENFGGLNILSQIYLFFLPPFIYYGIINKTRYKNTLFLLGFLLLIRSVIMSERMAFMEFLVPVFVTYFLVTQRRLYFTKLLKYFFIFLILFMAMELTRQFYNQYIAQGASVDVWFAISWTLERFFAYYADTTNKFYYSLTHDLGFTSQHYLTPFTRIIDRITSTDLNAIATVSEVDYGEYRWKDFTNPGGPTMLFTDFGYFSVFIFILLFFAFFKSYKLIWNGSLYALCFYPNLVTVVLELPRFVNFYNTRFFVPLVFFSLVFLSYKYLSIRFPLKKLTRN